MSPSKSGGADEGGKAPLIQRYSGSMAQSNPKSLDRRMTDYEALIWNIEKDPWLSSNVGGVAILDRPVDFDEFRARIANAVYEIPILRSRVFPGLGRLAPPKWATDPEFDLDHHLRRISMPPGSTMRDLFDLAVEMLADPFDRTRPLWQFVLIGGLEDGKGALFSKLHHTIADGKAAVQMALHYMTLQRQAEPPPARDLDALIAGEAVADARIADKAVDAVGQVIRRAIVAAYNTADQIRRAAVEPDRLGGLLGDLADTARLAASQLEATENTSSSVWSKRSRHRRFDGFEVELAEAKTAANALGGKLNDFFLTGAVDAGARYHEHKGVEPPDDFTVTFVVATRVGDSSTGNDFTIIPATLPAGPMPIEERFRKIHAIVGKIKGEVHGSTMFNAMAGILNLLPTSVVTSTTRNRAGNLDFATSNVPAAPIPVYVGGAKALALYPIGPLAGVAFNVTTISYAGTMFFGLNVDPVAIDEPDALLGFHRDAYAELIKAAGR